MAKKKDETKATKAETDEALATLGKSPMEGILLPEKLSDLAELELAEAGGQDELLASEAFEAGLQEATDSRPTLAQPIIPAYIQDRDMLIHAVELLEQIESHLRAMRNHLGK